MKNFSLRISNLILTFFTDQNKNFIEIAQTSNTKPIRIPNKFQPPTHPKFHPKFQTSHKNRIITTQKTDLSAKWAKQWVAPGVVQQVPSSRVHSTKRGRTRWPRSRSTISTSYDQGGYFEHTHASGVQCSANLARISPDARPGRRRRRAHRENWTKHRIDNVQRRRRTAPDDGQCE